MDTKELRERWIVQAVGRFYEPGSPAFDRTLNRLLTRSTDHVEPDLRERVSQIAAILADIEAQGWRVVNGAQTVEALALKHVPQIGETDCGIAALASATGNTYDAIASYFADRPSLKRGLNEDDLADWCYRNGFTYQKIDKMYRGPEAWMKRDPWPPRPWASAHLAMVVATMGNHITAVDAHGRTFDPFDASRMSLSDPVYKDVFWVMGLFPLTPNVLGAAPQGEKR